MMMIMKILVMMVIIMMIMMVAMIIMPEVVYRDMTTNTIIMLKTIKMIFLYNNDYLSPL